MIKINCDIGEREPDNPVDIELMGLIHIANVACGGHAGNSGTVKVFLELADRRKVDVSAHLSYPDRENFGRTTPDITHEKLIESLDEQYSIMPHVKMVKFHGALYNDCNDDDALSAKLADWLLAKGVNRIITPFDSALAAECLQRGIKTVAEAFAERRYVFNRKSGRLALVSRKKSYASITDCDEAVKNSVNIIENGIVDTVEEQADGSLNILPVEIKAETICIHSDSEIALELAKRLSLAGRSNV